MSAPMESMDICELSVRDAAAAIAAGTLQASALLDALLQQIARYDGLVQAWCFIDEDAARACARTLDDEARAGSLRGPLHGVPIGLKDVFHAVGMPTRADSRALDG